MKNYRCWDLIEDEQPELWDGGTRVYDKAEVDAALAAKDAEIGVLRESLRSIAASLIKYGQHHAICEFMNSRRACTCGFIEATDYASQEHSAALSKSPATHPDTARLDKLPAVREAMSDKHPDELAVAKFASAMNDKLAEKRDEGKYGWDDPDVCSIEFLWNELAEHVINGDPIDIANFAMMIWCRNLDIRNSVREAIDAHQEPKP